MMYGGRGRQYQYQHQQQQQRNNRGKVTAAATATITTSGGGNNNDARQHQQQQGCSSSGTSGRQQQQQRVVLPSSTPRLHHQQATQYHHALPPPPVPPIAIRTTSALSMLSQRGNTGASSTALISSPRIPQTSWSFVRPESSSISDASGSGGSWIFEAEIEKLEQENPNPEEFPPELLIKHPLQNMWTLWYYEQDKNRSWEESQREITSFDTAEDFWSLYNHIKQASELRTGCDYSMFKHGIRPMWEDDANKHGGRWLINLERRQRSQDLDNFWLEVLLCMIGEGFNEHSDDICGAVVNIRGKQDKIAVWTSNANTMNSVMEIGRKLKERLRITSKNAIAYQAHKDTMSKVGSMPKTTYTI